MIFFDPRIPSKLLVEADVVEGVLTYVVKPSFTSRFVVGAPERMIYLGIEQRAHLSTLGARFRPAHAGCAGNPRPLARLEVHQYDLR